MDSMTEDPRVVLLGEDIGVMGGAFRVTRGLHEEFGADRVIDTPIAEIAIIGTAIGLAISGWRPVAELQFADFISCAYDQLVNEAAKLHYRFGIAVPMVVRCPAGGGLGAGPFHSQCPEGVFAHIPGLKILCPGTVQDAYDLIRLAVEDPDPVLFFEQKALYRSLRADLVRGRPVGNLGVAAVRRAGSDVTVVTYGSMVPRALDAAVVLAAEAISVEVVDLRTLAPLDLDAVAASVAKTSRVVVVHEDTRTGGFGGELITALFESEIFYSLDAPPARVTAPDTPAPFAKPLEERYVPSVDRITDVVRRVALA
jgi:2-oxoisovalerate dehydrogenase E1 component beta subunit